MARSDFVQVARSVPWLEPLEAYRRLRASGARPVLLDGMGAHPEARFAFVAFDPLVEVCVRGRDVEERWADGAVEFVQEAPLVYLRLAFDRFRFEVGEEAPFTGGWVGLLGFGLAQAMEPSLPPGPRGDSSAPPDVWLQLCLGCLVFDRSEQTVRAFRADCAGDREACDARVEAVVAQLAQPVVRTDAPPVGPPAAAAWTASLDQAAFERAVVRLKGLIHGGDLFQANLATRFATACTADPADLFAALRDANPSPFMALVEAGDFAVVSGSPELLLSARDGTLASRPIAGTRRRGSTDGQDAALEQELRTDAKEQAEHTMLVDLVRNDVAKVSVPGSVAVSETGTVERYRHVMHLASRVEGQIREGTAPTDWLCALFPGGTVTGAPKVRATQRILEAEPVPRGFYTGSAGYVSWSHNSAWNILIRTLQLHGGQAHVHAGSGIVADSEPRREWLEAQRKGQALLDAATGNPSDSPATRLGEVTRGGGWAPPVAASRHVGKRVLVIDNYDSFVHNLADYVASLGARVRVVRNDEPWRAEVAVFRPTHIILSPGPGWPDEAGCTLEMARELAGRLPILGVCLGHQAIGQAHGATVRVHPGGPVHGKASAVHHSGAGLFAGLPSPLAVGRYHSLVVDAASMGADWIVDARLDDGTVMSLRHRRHPVYGLQFHPESLCTDRGLELLDRFLETRA